MITEKLSKLLDEILRSMEILNELEREFRSDDVIRLKEIEKKHAKVVSSLISRLHTTSEEFYTPEKGESILYVFSVSFYQERSKDVVNSFARKFKVLVISISRPCHEFSNVKCLEHSIDKKDENQFSSIPEVMILLDRFNDVDLVVLDSLPALSVISSENELRKFIYYLTKKMKETGRSMAIFTIEGTVPSELEAFVATLCNKTVTLK